MASALKRFSTDDEERELGFGERMKLCCKFHWRGWVIFLTPLIFLPICFKTPRAAFKCLYVILIMAVYWITECIPAAGTAMIPIAFFPLLGIMDNKPVCMAYLKDSTMWFFASYIVSLGLQHSLLSNRIGLWMLSKSSQSPKAILLIFMIFTAILSMWIPNAGAAAIASVILRALLDDMAGQGSLKVITDEEVKFETHPPFPSKIAIGLFMGVAYAASIGGATTLIGTDTNIMFVGVYESTFPESDDINFVNFLIISLLPFILNLIFTYVWLMLIYTGGDDVKAATTPEAAAAFKNSVKNKQTENGSMSCHEFQVLVLIIIWIVATITRKPGFMAGWAEILNKKQILLSVPVMLIVALLFMIPVNYSFFKYCLCKRPNPEGTLASLMTWKVVHSQLPWGMFLVVGSAFAICEAMKSSGLSVQIYNLYAKFGDMPQAMAQGVCIVVAVIFTSVTANSGMGAILMPTIAQLSQTIDCHPLYIMLPTTIAQSMAFHLPASSPPNAIAAGYGNVRAKEMMLAGIGPTIITIITTFIAAQVVAPMFIENYTSYLKFSADHI
ncbi:protein I'm not dead yet-like [Teleopsis dalmanni]|uniref:protein I'm not dead yet-like n=1 Tax=Teleopsis dalmanni TaxID=139649 RepID=UPI0018CC9142|nr:protein I'm not dead yet-like [Teleopsis dalmanni]